MLFHFGVLLPLILVKYSLLSLYLSFPTSLPSSLSHPLLSLPSPFLSLSLSSPDCYRYRSSYASFPKIRPGSLGLSRCSLYSPFPPFPPFSFLSRRTIGGNVTKGFIFGEVLYWCLLLGGEMGGVGGREDTKFFG